MTGDALHEAARALVVRTTRAQGLPEQVIDTTTLARVAEVIDTPKPTTRQKVRAA